MALAGVPGKRGPWRVFLSHTGELDRFPVARTYVQIAIDAVQDAGHYPIDMRHFPNRDVTPSAIDRDRLQTCDVYLGIFGLRWGSTCATNPERSYTEEEYEIAGERKIPRRIFLLDKSSSELGMSPIELGYTEQTLEMQRAFRNRVGERVAAFVKSPDGLATKIVGALADLERLQSDGVSASRSSVTGRSRSNIPLASAGLVHRDGKIDEVVSRLLDGTSVRVTSVKGAGGVGKTIVAEQVCRDPRIPGGTWKVTIGQNPDLERIARELFHIVRGRDAVGNVSPVIQMPDAFTTEPTLVMLDDIWPPDDVARELMDALPAQVSVLVTTRGVQIPGTEPISVDELLPGEALRVLLGAHADTAPPEVAVAATELVEALGSWALLVDMAARLLADDLRGPPTGVIEALRGLADEFRSDPTKLDDESSRDRSFGRIVERSTIALSDVHRVRFERLSVFPADAELGIEVLTDLWGCSPVEARQTKQALEQVGLSRGFLDPPRVGLHDLVTAWLHHTIGVPGSHPDWHLQCVRHVIGVDGSPGELTVGRVEWLPHHLIAARAWDLLRHLTTRRWRNALLAATGSDAELYTAIEAYVDAALRLLPEDDQISHVFGAVVFGAHVRALAGNIPAGALVTQALLGSPIAAMTQAVQRPDDPGSTLLAILQRLAERPDYEVLVARAVELANTIPDDGWRSGALAGIAQQIATINPALAEVLVARAVELANTIPGDGWRSEALAGIAQQIATTSPADEVLVARAVELANTIPDDGSRSGALAGVAQQIATTNPALAEVLVARAVELANTIPDDWSRSGALAGIAGSSSSTTLWTLAAPWRRHDLFTVLKAASAYVAAANRAQRVYPATEAGLAISQSIAEFGDPH